MENAVKALEMAFAVMVFVIALSVSMISFNKVKATSDIVLYAQDKTNKSYREYQEGNASEKNRIVGLETIIPTLYEYYKGENYTVVFRVGDYNKTTGEFSNLNPLPIYTNNTKYSEVKDSWGREVEGKGYSTYDLLMYKKYNKYTIDEHGEVTVEPNVFSDIYDAIRN